MITMRNLFVRAEEDVLTTGPETRSANRRDKRSSKRRRWPLLLLAVAFLVLLPGLALAQGPDQDPDVDDPLNPSGDPERVRIQLEYDVVPDDLVQDEYQTIVVTIRNINEEYTGVEIPESEEITDGDAWIIDFGDICVREILDIKEVRDSLQGNFVEDPDSPTPYSGSDVVIVFEGYMDRSEYFEPDDFVEVRVEVRTWAMPSSSCENPPCSCEADPQDDEYPGTIWCESTITPWEGPVGPARRGRRAPAEPQDLLVRPARPERPVSRDRQDPPAWPERPARPAPRDLRVPQVRLEPLDLPERRGPRVRRVRPATRGRQGRQGRQEPRATRETRGRQGRQEPRATRGRQGRREPMASRGRQGRQGRRGRRATPERQATMDRSE